MNLIEELSRNAFVDSPATPETIEITENQLGVTLPHDYKQAMLAHNGYSSNVNGYPLSLWEVDKLAELNDAYLISMYTPNLVTIGSDGGSLCLVFDYRSSPPVLSQVPFGDVDYLSLEPLASSLTDFVTMLLNREN